MKGVTNEICSVLIGPPLREKLDADKLSRHRLNEAHRLCHALRLVQSAPVNFQMDRPRDENRSLQCLLAQRIQAVTSGNVPDEIIRARPFPPTGLFVQEHLHAGIHTEKNLTIRRNGKDIMVREKSPGNVITHHPHTDHPARPEQRVFLDERTRQVFFDQHFPEGQGCVFDIIDGRRCISVQGQHHELTYNGKTTYPEIRIEADGKLQALPVYMEKLSHTWHLSELHGRPVFNRKRQALINKIKMDGTTDYAYLATDNLHPATYGGGKIYEVRRQEAFSSEAPLMRVIEMHGELVPVRVRVTPEHGVGYEIYDPAVPDKSGHAAEWSGGRWQFEQASSVHLSEPLKRAIGPRMFRKDIHQRDLSAPDQQGLQWDRDHNCYLKVKNHYVQLHHDVAHPDIRNRYFIKRENGDSMALRFRGNQFHKENHSERLSTILVSGLNGRGYNARQWLIESRGGDNAPNRQWAEKLLSRYQFPQHGPASDLEFARHVFEWDGVTPRWAETYRIHTFDVQDMRGNHANLGYYVNHLLGEGVEGRIYADANDANVVIKQYFADMDELDDIVEAGDNFSRFYGDGSAQVFQGQNHIFMRMKKLDGKPLDQIDAFPPGAADKFNAMLHKLADKGIYHSELKPDNVLWDATKKVFNPIDFGLCAGKRLIGFAAEDLFTGMQLNTKEVIHLIDSKTVPH